MLAYTLTAEMPAVIKLLRPHQYLKNGFVLIGPLFAHQWGAETLTHAMLVFLSFCAMASAVYILNDLADIEADRAHPVKRKRPLPSASVSSGFAKRLLLCLAFGSLLLSWVVSTWAMVFVSLYFFINILYSWKLKHVVIADVFVISAGFMLRIMAGTIGLGIQPSAWLLLCGLMVTLFLGFAKRRAELLLMTSSGAAGGLTRRVLDDYSPAMLEQFIAITSACTIISYGLYTVAPQTVALHGSLNLIYTLPFVIYGIFRYLFLLHKQSKGNDTAGDLLADRHLLYTVVAWVAVVIGVLS